MYPLSRKKTLLHREKKRRLEIEITINYLKNYLDLDNEKCNILEFGCGDGFQINALKILGKVTACDIKRSEKLVIISEEFHFVETSIENTPFEDSTFDLIYSNHVIEHLCNIEKAFKEIKRIGKHGCIYAFSVPTNYWVILSLPANIFIVTRGGIEKVIEIIKKVTIKNCLKSILKIVGVLAITLYRIFVKPKGHGVYKNFFSAYFNFRLNKWHRFFSRYFKVISYEKLLLYAPSEWPVVPTTRKMRKAIYSSVLVIVKK